MSTSAISLRASQGLSSTPRGPRPDISFVQALLVEFGHESCILAWTYLIIRFDELKAIIMHNVALSASALDRFLWVPNFPLSTIGAHDRHASFFMTS